MHCFSCSGDKQLWRVAEWLERKRALVRRAAAGPVVVADPAAAAVVQAVVVAARAEAAVVASPVEVGAADRVNSPHSSGASLDCDAPFFY